MTNEINREETWARLQQANARLKQANARLAAFYHATRQFADNVAPRLRSHLSVIKEISSIVREGFDGQINDRQRQHLDIVAGEVEDLGFVIDDMFVISDIVAGRAAMRRRQCRVADIVDGVRRALERKLVERNNSLEVDLEDDLPESCCDPRAIGRAIMILVDQASERAGCNGKIRLRVARGADPSEITVCVSDHGPTISPEDIELIRDRFTMIEERLRRSMQHFDVGVNVAKALACMNLGDLAVASDSPRGASFTLTVPIADAESLVARYLRRAKALGQSGLSADLIVASIDPAVDANIAEEVGWLLEYAVNCADLVVRVSQSKWLLVTGPESEHPKTTIDKVLAEWKATNRDRCGPSLPEIHFEVRDQLQLASPGDSSTDATDGQPCREIPAPRSLARVLLVDDDRHIIEGIAIRLRATGYDVLVAHNGQQGIDLAARHQPDAIVLDILMPGMDGLATLKQLKRRHVTRHIPVVMMSANVIDDHKLLDLGAIAYLRKPFRSDDLITALRSATPHADTARSESMRNG